MLMLHCCTLETATVEKQGKILRSLATMLGSRNF
jgi:hypothetical protein